MEGDLGAVKGLRMVVLGQGLIQGQRAWFPCVRSPWGT